MDSKLAQHMPEIDKLWEEYDRIGQGISRLWIIIDMNFDIDNDIYVILEALGDLHLDLEAWINEKEEGYVDE